MATRKRTSGEKPSPPPSVSPERPPAARTPLPLPSLLFFMLRSVMDYSKKEIADLLELPSRLVGRHENGKEPPSWLTLFAMVGGAKRPLFLVHEMRYSMLHHYGWPETPSPDEEAREEMALRATGARLFAAMPEAAELSDGICLAVPASARAPEAAPEEVEAWAAERHAALEFWDGLTDTSLWERRSHPWLSPRRLTSWAECERLCAESLRLTHQLIADGLETYDPRFREAEELAWLALRSACLSRTKPPWRPRLAEYAWAHIGATRGLRGDFRGAEEAFFHMAEHLHRNHQIGWGPLAGGVPLFLKAQIRLRQGQDEAALALVRHALTGLAPGHLEAMLLEAEIHLRQGRPAEAAASLEAVLSHAALRPPGRRIARRAVRLLAEGAVGLLSAGRGAEVASLLDERSEALVEAASLSAGAGAQLRLFLRLMRQGRLEAPRAARMVEELRGLMAPPVKPRR